MLIIESFNFCSGLNFVTLKSLHKTGGLYPQICKCFEFHIEARFRGIDEYNVARIIGEYFQKFSFSRNDE
jgi:hypothetical protein